MEATEASRLIEEALQKAMMSNEDYEDGDLVVDWVLVSYVTNADEEKSHGYPMFVSNGEMPVYRVRGLLETGIEKLNRR